MRWPGETDHGMQPSLLYSFALEATALLALWLGLGVAQHDREAPGRLTFVALTAGVFAWCVGAALAEREVIGDWWQIRTTFVGVLAVPPLWLGVAAHAARLGLARRAPWFPAALLMPSVAFYAILFAGPWSALFLGPAPWPESQGPLFGVWTAYSYGLVLGATAVLIVSGLRSGDPRARRRRIATAFAAVLPLAANVVFLFLVPQGRDLTPVLLGVTLLALRSGVFHGGLLDALPIHHRDLYRQLPVGIVIADPHDRVIDLNEEASALLGFPREEALGRALDAVLAAAPPGLEPQVTPIRAGGREKARCAILHRAAERREAAA